MAVVSQLINRIAREPIGNNYKEVVSKSQLISGFLKAIRLPTRMLIEQHNCCGWECAPQSSWLAVESTNSNAVYLEIIWKF